MLRQQLRKTPSCPGGILLSSVDNRQLRPRWQQNNPAVAAPFHNPSSLLLPLSLPHPQPDKGYDAGKMSRSVRHPDWSSPDLRVPPRRPRFQPPSEPGAGSYRSDLDRGSPGNRSVVAASLLLRPSAPNVQHDNDYDDAHQDEQVSKSIRTSHVPDPPLTPSFRHFGCHLDSQHWYIGPQRH